MNAKDNAVIDRFVELRAQGWTFARIAAELDVSKPTLIAWSRKHQHRIHNLRALETEALERPVARAVPPALKDNSCYSGNPMRCTGK